MKKTVTALLISICLILFGAGTALARTGGPDAYGYTFIDSDEAAGPTYSMIDISGTGNFAMACDDCNNGPYDFNFVFPFYGNDYDQFWIASNGGITFSNLYLSTSNATLPQNDDYNNLIAVLWDDIQTGLGGQGIYYQYFANCPHPDFSGPCMVVMWSNASHYYNSGSFDFEAILFPNGNILMQYSAGNPELGSNSGTGIENLTGDIALVYAQDQASSLQDNLAILFVYNRDDGDDDGDGMPNYWENFYGLDKNDADDAALDSDDDGLSNLGEYQNGTRPDNWDTDGDGLSDGDEVNQYGSDPLDTDTDDDGLTDGDEAAIGTSPTNSDSDGDELSDGTEVYIYRTDPTTPYTDEDWITDYDEINSFWQTDPLERDSDHDGLSDYDEAFIYDTNPWDPDDPGPFTLNNTDGYEGENSKGPRDEGEESYVVYNRDEDTFLGMKCFITASGAGSGSLGTVFLSILAACAGFLARIRIR
ncbi:MAG TPA: hypothetical protein PLU54_10070 [Deltaproteobacteria bacterium]|nr:hypothetical protein [Deltaproteobacteria bacterium]